MNDDDERQTRLAAIRLRHEALDFGMAHPDTGRWIARVSCKGCHRPWPCEQSVLLAEVERLEAERDEARAWSARWKAVAKRVWSGVHHPLDMCEFQARKREAAEAERDAATAHAERAELDHRATYAVLSRFSYAVQQTRWPKMDNSQWQAVIDLAHGRPITVLIAEARAALAEQGEAG